MAEARQKPQTVCASQCKDVARPVERAKPVRFARLYRPTVFA
ncbi:hypothetical protein SCH4B_0553 [Ruegeria sp. TrichCH4B]|nr:hypothetical protein SCH4B_0553 [Ruegeria sp. TrichCH4B]